MDRFPRVRLDNPTHEARVRDGIDKIRRYEAQSECGEREKTSEERRVIALVHTMSETLLAYIGVGTPPTVYDEQIHIIDPTRYISSIYEAKEAREDFLERTKTVPAGYNPDTGQIVVWDSGNLTNEKFLVYLLHETLHLISDHLFSASEEKRKILFLSSGIRGIDGEKCTFLDEAVIQTLVRDLCSDFSAEIKELDLNFETVMQRARGARNRETNAFLSLIVANLSRGLNVTPEEIVKRMARSLFTGSSDAIDMVATVWGDSGARAISQCDFNRRSKYTEAVFSCFASTGEECARCLDLIESSS